jgi:hypothetical protein
MAVRACRTCTFTFSAVVAWPGRRGDSALDRNFVWAQIQIRQKKPTPNLPPMNQNQSQAKESVGCWLILGIALGLGGMFYTFIFVLGMYLLLTRLRPGACFEFMRVLLVEWLSFKFFIRYYARTFLVLITFWNQSLWRVLQSFCYSLKSEFGHGV